MGWHMVSQTRSLLQDRHLATYLRRATWGLPEARRQELWDELEEHVLTRADHLTLLGHSPDTALTQAIRELGLPARVTLGMAQVYTMPKLLLAAGTLALGISATLYALAGGSGPTITLPVVSNGLPEASCVKGTLPSETVVTVVSRKPESGITCSIFRQPSEPTFTLTPRGHISETTLMTAVKAVGGSAKVDQKGYLTFFTSSAAGSSSASFPATTIKDGERYFPVDTLLFLLLTHDVRLSGFDRPTIRAKDFGLTIGDRADESVGQAFYSGFTRIFAGQFTNTNQFRFNTDTGPYLHTNQTSLPQGEVVMLMTAKMGTYTADYAPVGAGGVVKLHSFSPHIVLIDHPKTLDEQPQDGVFNAVLLQVSNVPINEPKRVLTDQPTSDAR